MLPEGYISTKEVAKILDSPYGGKSIPPLIEYLISKHVPHVLGSAPNAWGWSKSHIVALANERLPPKEMILEDHCKRLQERVNRLEEQYKSVLAQLAVFDKFRHRYEFD